MCPGGGKGRPRRLRRLPSDVRDTFFSRKESIPYQPERKGVGTDLPVRAVVYCIYRAIVDTFRVYHRCRCCSGNLIVLYSALKKFFFAVRTPLLASESDKNVPSQP